MSINIVLYQPEIPPNTGNIARTCALTGIKLHLIKPLGFHIDDKSLKRAGLDYWHLLNLEVHDSLEDFLKKYGDQKIFLSTTKATQYHSDVKYENGCFIMFGKETAGLPDSLHKRYKNDEIKIPMLSHEDVRSLNLSNSVAIIAYEALRQIGYSF
ncbi:tRNA (uridine(34)/cytosine(34)/5-carboxymethylaminomethyluridine(34)-2'-O)-methyltransferase TrmL [Clostridiaceae bacterium HSG29]|nr:tRNA (uridine(34)/cytosine(34)/5-carboxymethylaminomethyluridine(34)-2'-O)-methyltransferase TrmL [Clostridiaceae bacterium HSG29]